jgi:hypothetical protein
LHTSCDDASNDLQTRTNSQHKRNPNSSGNSSRNTSFDSALTENVKAPSTTSPLLSSIINASTTTVNATITTATTPNLKRKRKNRTAFTANQIFELEKRFSNQRYLSPHDRDRIAYELSLSTAQVITWFQNRRAKQKRDIEELKNDVMAAKSVSALNADLDVDKVLLKSESQQQMYQQFSNFNAKYDGQDHQEDYLYYSNNEDNTDNESYSTDADDDETQDLGNTVKAEITVN